LKKALLVLAAAAMWIAPAWADSDADSAREVLALERQAMDGWLKGNPDPQLAITDSQITYFHVMLERRIEGLPVLKDLYEQYRGTPLYDSYEIVNPKVQVCGDVAVLTYQLERRNGAATSYWNGTQVYQKKKEGWRIIHTHWSAAKPPQP
jgi:hypothetical protein